MLGGVGFVMLLVTAVAYYQGFPEETVTWYLAALVLTILSVFGDLSESMFKRVARLKRQWQYYPGSWRYFRSYRQPDGHSTVIRCVGCLDRRLRVMRTSVILGATGSIGCNTLDVVAHCTPMTIRC